MLLLFLACKAPTDAGPAPGDDSAAIESTPPEAVPGAPKGPEGCGDLYDEEALLDFEVEIDEREWSALLRDYENGEKDYHDIRFRWGDEEVDAHIRLKGNPNFSWMTEKMQFVVAFNQDDPDARFHGVRKISLDATWYEPTLLRDRVSWVVMRRVEGLPSICANNARLSINGEFYGLYANIEFMDHEWLERHWGDLEATGTLWKYGQEPVANEENADYGRINRLWTTTNPDTLATLGDVAEWELEWAAEAVLGTDDGYWCCNHNFYIYDHPTRGLLFVPWDFDDNFQVMQYDADPIEGYTDIYFGQPQFTVIVNDDVWGPRYRDALAQVLAAFDPDELLPLIDRWAAQTDEAAQTDPTRSYEYAERLAEIEAMKAWVVARHGYLHSWLRCDAGGGDGDGDGASACQDRNDLDASIHPGAEELCDGVDNDSDGWIDDNPDCDDCRLHALDGHTFLYCRWPRTWEEAADHCAARGGELAVPNTSYRELIPLWFYTWPIIEPWWLGATDAAREGTWRDTHGNTVSGSWASGEPDGSSRQNCAAWSQQDFAWISEDCAASHPSICRL